MVVVNMRIVVIMIAVINIIIIIIIITSIIGIFTMAHDCHGRMPRRFEIPVHEAPGDACTQHLPKQKKTLCTNVQAC